MINLAFILQTAATGGKQQSPYSSLIFFLLLHLRSYHKEIKNHKHKNKRKKSYKWVTLPGSTGRLTH